MVWVSEMYIGKLYIYPSRRACVPILSQRLMIIYDRQTEVGGLIYSMSFVIQKSSIILEYLIHEKSIELGWNQHSGN